MPLTVGRLFPPHYRVKKPCQLDELGRMHWDLFYEEYFGKDRELMKSIREDLKKVVIPPMKKGCEPMIFPSGIPIHSIFHALNESMPMFEEQDPHVVAVLSKSATRFAQGLPGLDSFFVRGVRRHEEVYALQMNNKSVSVELSNSTHPEVPFPTATLYEAALSELNRNWLIWGRLFRQFRYHQPVFFLETIDLLGRVQIFCREKPKVPMDPHRPWRTMLKHSGVPATEVPKKVRVIPVYE